jgi:hypothetical protein
MARRPVTVIVGLAGIVLGLLLIVRDYNSHHQDYRPVAGTRVDYSDTQPDSGQQPVTDPATPAQTTPPQTATPPPAAAVVAANAACKLLSVAALNQEFGGSAVVTGVNVSQIAEADCVWTITGSPLLGTDATLELDLDHTVDAHGEGFKSFEKSQIDANQSTDLPGLGDAAYVTPNSDSISFLKAHSEVSMQVISSATVNSFGKIRGHLVTLAQQVVPKLS